MNTYSTVRIPPGTVSGCCRSLTAGPFVSASRFFWLSWQHRHFPQQRHAVIQCPLFRFNHMRREVVVALFPLTWYSSDMVCLQCMCSPWLINQTIDLSHLKIAPTATACVRSGVWSYSYRKSLLPDNGCWLTDWCGRPDPSFDCCCLLTWDDLIMCTWRAALCDHKSW